MITELKFHVSNEGMGRWSDYSIYVWSSINGKHGILKDLPTFELLNEDDPRLNSRPPALLEMSLKDATNLMDALWRAGIRPSNGEGSVGMIDAIKDHLKDMRKIAFSKLGITND